MKRAVSARLAILPGKDNLPSACAVFSSAPLAMVMLQDIDEETVDMMPNYDGTTEITTKKLWVAAIDLNAKAGTDPSHPAFYLPAQELLAGNARGFWALAPCKADGMSCQSGDQCCNGYCEPGDGGLVCASSPPMNSCSGVGDNANTCRKASPS